MGRRFVSLWFRHLTTDWFTLRQPSLKEVPFVLAVPDHGRKVITAANLLAQEQGVDAGMVVADARIVIPTLDILDDKPQLPAKLLRGLALWCIRYTPLAAVDQSDGLFLDVSGCTHLWGGERPYLKHLVTTLRSKGYDVRGAMADTMGAAWAIARFGRQTPIIGPGEQAGALLSLPPAALRLEPAVIARLEKLGFRQVRQVLGTPRQALRRRFGKDLLQRIDQALGQEEEFLLPVEPVEPFSERLPFLEPICTAGGIEYALRHLLDTLCGRLQQEGKGIRTAVFKGYRVDGKLQQINIGTNRASYNPAHLFRLFEEKIPTIEPDLGIELFQLDATKVEDLEAGQASLWKGSCGLEDTALSELLDRITNKVGPNVLHRYLPAEHYPPERAITMATIMEKPAFPWPDDKPRPIQLLPHPDPVEVTAPIPDYPPMLFRHRGKLHKILRADGPERIENEWWMEGARHRDYYVVEDEEGGRFWLFRSGHYTGPNTSNWFLHGIFA